MPNLKRKKAIELAKKITRQKGICVKCGRRKVDGWQIQGAHIFPVRYGNTAADLENILPLCSYCHIFAKDSWHDSPLENWEWFNEKYPGRYEKLKEKAYRLDKPDWDAIYNSLKELENRG